MRQVHLEDGTSRHEIRVLAGFFNNAAILNPLNQRSTAFNNFAWLPFVVDATGGLIVCKNVHHVVV